MSMVTQNMLYAVYTLFNMVRRLTAGSTTVYHIHRCLKRLLRLESRAPEARLVKVEIIETQEKPFWDSSKGLE